MHTVFSKKSGYDLFWDTFLYVLRDFNEYSTEYGRDLLWLVIGAFRNRLFTKPYYIVQKLESDLHQRTPRSFRNEGRTLKGAPHANFFPFSNSTFVRMGRLAGWKDGSLERTGRRSFSQDDIKGIVCSNRDQRHRRHSQNNVARRILLHESWYAFLFTDLS
ncbi:hypothetical protein CDAR_424351 [Caerostris darwini]|uniref:Ribosomal protein S3 n=1 Tax=Caerostris darwini TaxID=1538125 RepID=A0AAV4T383_9ARAC|nr:hypothetical protein CDAR_424351 [Caerostris darwini]